MPVLVPFGRGNRMTNAYVVGITENAQFQEDRMKEIAAVPEHPVGVETRLIALASWMKETYGSAMIQALKTVLPMKQEIKTKQKRTIRLLQTQEEARGLLQECEKKHRTARARVIKALLERGELDYARALKELNITAAVLGPLSERGVISVESETQYRSPELPEFDEEPEPILSEEQRHAAGQILEEMNHHMPKALSGLWDYGEWQDPSLYGTHRQCAAGRTPGDRPDTGDRTDVSDGGTFSPQIQEKAAVIHSRMSQGNDGMPLHRPETARCR